MEETKMIMEFMGIHPIMYSPNVYTWNNGTSFSVRERTPEKVIDSVAKYLEPKYKTDWNWLMEVVREINKPCFDDYESFGDLVTAVSSASIEDTYKEAVCAIEWYNENNWL